MTPATNSLTLAFFNLLLLCCLGLQGQEFTAQDSLRGGVTPQRAWWDLQYYNLEVTIDPATKKIWGANTIYYKIISEQKEMQIDLQPPMKIDSVVVAGKKYPYKSIGNAHMIALPAGKANSLEQIVTVYFSGLPKEAVRAPWDGGFSWKKDPNGNPFIATSCQGLGASVWWPNKDHMYDEPDRGMTIAATVPKGLINVSNGQLIKTIENVQTNTFVWEVKNPINNYGVNVNIGDYVHFGETYTGEKGPLKMDYYVLENHLEKAKEQFKQAPKMMAAFEHWFGPYPFYKDGFKLVEVPYLGMEHQSSVTYGNQYSNGYLGKDLSGTGWGLKFDFIIIHESGHEWFANNITYKDAADMWVHEGFTAYSENLYLDYYFGKEAAADYVIGTRANIANDIPIIGPYGVNKSGSKDMYYKGANLLHTLRTWLNNDSLWRETLRGLNKTFYHKTVTTQEIESYIASKTGLNLNAFFNQYLRNSNIPTLEYKIVDNQLSYRYANCVEGFNMPLFALVGDTSFTLSPTTEWQLKELPTLANTLEIQRDYYVCLEKVL